MPELPEAETIARTLFPHIANCIFESAVLLRQKSLHPLSMSLDKAAGLKVAGTRRRGKLVIIDLDDLSSSCLLPKMLVFHLRMTGRVFAKDESWPSCSHTRCFFSLLRPSGERIKLFFDDIRAFGQIMLTTKKMIENWKFWKELGPEPFETDLKTFKNAIKGGRPVKTVLMDQKTIAGIGNIYADESLFCAGINPKRPADSITELEAQKLLTSIQAILKKSISECGSSIRDYLDANGNAGAFQNFFSVYGKGGKNCIKCGAILQKTKINGRATVFCSNCQN